MCASTDASTIATSTSLCTTSSTVVTSSALEVMHASPGSRYTCDAEPLAPAAQELAEAPHRVPRGRERDAASQADPVHRTEDVGVAVGDVAARRVPGASKSSFSQLKWNIRPRTLVAAARTSATSTTPRRECGRAGSARSNAERLTPGLTRSPSSGPWTWAARRSSWDTELKITLSARALTAVTSSGVKATL